MSLEQVKQSLKKINDALALNNLESVAAELVYLADRAFIKSPASFTKNGGIETTLLAMETFPTNVDVISSGCKLFSMVISSGSDQDIDAIFADAKTSSVVASAFVAFSRNREIELSCLRILAEMNRRTQNAFSSQEVASISDVILKKMKVADKRDALTVLRWEILGGLSADPKVSASIYETFGVDGVVKALQGPAASDCRCITGCLCVLSAFATDPSISQSVVGNSVLSSVTHVIKRCRGDLVAFECCCNVFSAAIKASGSKCKLFTDTKVMEEIMHWAKLFSKNKASRGLCVCQDIIGQIMQQCSASSAEQMLQTGIIEVLLDATAMGISDEAISGCVFVVHIALEKLIENNYRLPSSVVSFFKERGAKIAVSLLTKPIGIELVTYLADIPELAAPLIKAGAQKVLGDIIAQPKTADGIIEYACVALGKIATSHTGGRVSEMKIVNSVISVFKRYADNETVLRTICYTLATLLNNAHPDIYKVVVDQGILDSAISMIRNAGTNLSACLNPCCIVKDCIYVSLGIGPNSSSTPDYISRIIKQNGIEAVTNILRKTMEFAADSTSSSSTWENFEVRRVQISALEILSSIMSSEKHPEVKDIFVKDNGLYIVRVILLGAVRYGMNTNAIPKNAVADSKLRDSLWMIKSSLEIFKLVMDEKPEHAKRVQQLLFPEYSDGCIDVDSKDLKSDLHGKGALFLLFVKDYPDKELILKELIGFIVECLKYDVVPAHYVLCKIESFIKAQKEFLKNSSIQYLVGIVVCSVLRKIKQNDNDSYKAAANRIADNDEVDLVISALAAHPHDTGLHIAGVEVFAELFQISDIREKYLTAYNARSIMALLARFPDVEEYQHAVLMVLKLFRNEVRFKDEDTFFNGALHIAVTTLQNFILNDTIRTNSIDVIASFLEVRFIDISRLPSLNIVDLIVMAMTRSIEVNPFRNPLVTVNSQSMSAAKGRCSYSGELVIDKAFWEKRPENDEERMDAKTYLRFDDESKREISVQLKGIESLKTLLSINNSKNSDSSSQELNLLTNGLMKNSNNVKILKLILYNLVQWPSNGYIVSNGFMALKNLFQLFPVLQEEAVLYYNAIDVILNVSWKQSLYRENPKMHTYAFQLISVFLSSTKKTIVPSLSQEARERVYNSLQRGDFIGYAIYSLKSYNDFSSFPIIGETIYPLVTERPDIFCPMIVKCGGIDVIYEKIHAPRIPYGAKYLINVLLAVYNNDPQMCIGNRHFNLRGLMYLVRVDTVPNTIIQYTELIQSIVSKTVECAPKGSISAIGGVRLSEVAFYLIVLLNAKKLDLRQTGGVFATLNAILKVCDEEVYERITSKRDTYEMFTAAIRDYRTQPSLLKKVLEAVEMITSYLGRKNMLWRLFKPYVDTTGRACEYKYLGPQFIGNAFQIIPYKIPYNCPAYGFCARTSNIFCSSPYYLARLRRAKKQSPSESSESFTKNLEYILSRNLCDTNVRAHAISAIFTMSKASKRPFYSTPVGKDWGIRASIRGLIGGLESPLCVSYAFACICLASLEGDKTVEDLISTADAIAVNLPLLFMTAMSLYPSTFGIQACGTLFLARCLAVFPDFVDKFLIAGKYEKSANAKKEVGKERLFVRLIQLVTAKRIIKSPDVLGYAVYILNNLLTTRSELLHKDVLGYVAAKRAIRVLSSALQTFVEKSDMLESVLLTLLEIVSASELLSLCVNPIPIARTMAYHDNNSNIQSVGVALLGLLPKSSNPIVKCALRKAAEKFKDDLFIYDTSMNILKSYE